MNRMPERFPAKSVDRALAGMLGPVTCVIQLEMGFDYTLDEKRLERFRFNLPHALVYSFFCPEICWEQGVGNKKQQLQQDADFKLEYWTG